MSDEPAARPVIARRQALATHPLMIGAILALATAMNPVSNDTILPGIPFLRREFGVEPDIAQLTLTVHIVAFAAMQLVYGPLSDRFGRRPVLLVSLAVYALASLLCAIAPTLELLLAGRALQGVGVAAGPVIARAMIRDLYGPEKGGKVMSYVMSAFGIIAVVAPIIGGVLVGAFGWRSSFYFCIAYAGMIALFVVLVLDETLAPENRQAARIGQIFANMYAVSRHPGFVVNTLANSALYAGMWAWLASAIFLLIEVVGQPVEQASVFFAISEFGFMAGAALAGRLSSRMAAPPMVIAGGCLSLVAACVLWGLAASGVVHTAALVVPGLFWMFGYGFFYPHTMAGAVAPFPTMAGAASSLIGFLQMMCAAGTAYLTGALYDGTAVPLGMMLIALTASGLVIYIVGRKTA